MKYNNKITEKKKKKQQTGKYKINEQAKFLKLYLKLVLEKSHMCTKMNFISTISNKNWD